MPDLNRNTRSEQLSQIITQLEPVYTQWLLILENMRDEEMNEIDELEFAQVYIHCLRGALSRAASDQYGICTACQQEIQLDRLQKKPEAERCFNCQREFELGSGS